MRQCVTAYLTVDGLTIDEKDLQRINGPVQPQDADTPADADDDVLNEEEDEI